MIDFKINREKVEGVKMSNEVFPSHFLCAIVGKPGSGKTSLLKFMLKHEELLFKKYNYVFIVTPSKMEFSNLFLPEANFCSALDWEWIQGKISMVNKEKKGYSNVLFILDDVICDLQKNKSSKEIMVFIFNRRHLLDCGMISIIMTTQKYVFLPTAIRSNLSLLVTFKLHKMDIKKITEEIIFTDNSTFKQIYDFVFDDQDLDSFLIYRIDNNKYFKKFNNIILD